MNALKTIIERNPENYKPVYTGELLYIIRNHGNDFDSNNRSILGVFNSPETAQKAILDAKQRQKNAGVYANMEVKVVIPNTSMYHGCSAYHINYLIEDPKSFEIAVRAWYNWPFIVQHCHITCP